MPPIRVLMHAPRVWGGGLEIHAVNLARELRRSGAEVTLVVHERFGEEGERRASLVEAGAELVNLPDLAWLHPVVRWGWYAAKVMRGLRGRSFDLVVCHGFGGSHWWFKRYLRPGGLFVWHDHTSGGRALPQPESFAELTYGAYPRKILRAVRSAGLIIIGSERGKRNLSRLHHLPCPVVVLPPLGCLDTVPRVTESSPRSGTLRVGVFGRLAPEKGIAPLLRLWPRLNIGAAELYLFGPDPERRYERMAESLKLQTVRFCGPYDARSMSRLAVSLDFGVICSVWEGYPLVALEFMACGLPFVMTRVGAAEELADGSPDIELAPVSEPGVREAIESMAAKVRRGATSRVRLQQRYFERFSQARIAHRYRTELLGRIQS